MSVGRGGKIEHEAHIHTPSSSTPTFPDSARSLWQWTPPQCASVSVKPPYSQPAPAPLPGKVEMGRAPSAVLTRPGAQSPQVGLPSLCWDRADDSGIGLDSADGSGPPTPRTPSCTLPQLLVTGVASLQGQKQALPDCPNQDSHLIVNLSRGKTLAAVFDGHGRNGHHVSRRVRDIFEQHAWSLGAASLQDNVSAVQSVFASVFAKAHDALVRDGLARLAGTTATVAIVDALSGRMVVAHVGDSTLVAANGRNIDFKSQDHKIKKADISRIHSLGGEVRSMVYGGVTARRVFVRGEGFPGLAMARALGDMEANAVGVLSEPEVQQVRLRPGCTVVLASDGVWDQMPSTEVVDRLAASFARRGPPTPELTTQLAEEVVSEARRRWLGAGFVGAQPDVDDITAVVLQAIPDFKAVAGGA